MIKIEGQVTVEDVDQVLKRFVEDEPDGSFLISIEDADGDGFSSMQGYKGKLIKNLLTLLEVDKEEHIIDCLDKAIKLYMVEQKKKENMKRISLSCKGARSDN